MNKDFLKRSLIIYAIITVVYALLVCVIPFPKHGAAWISFAFTIITLWGSFYAGYLAFKNEGMRSKLYGMPIYNVGLLFTIIQAAVSVVVFVLDALIIGFPWWIALIASVVILGLGAIGVILTDTARNKIEEIEEETKVNTQAMSYFRADTAALIDFCTFPELKKPLEALQEDFQYSDPVSSPATQDLENTILTELNKLSMMLQSGTGTVESLSEKITLVKNLLAQRNRVCKINK